ncbi:MAG: metalloregulator ArsR/SmtB family transcription factor [Acidimicrobiia bacterium]
MKAVDETDPFAILSDPIRRRIVELLADGERPAGEIAAQFDVTGPAISRHLRVLRGSGIVTHRREAQRWLYSLNPKPIEDAHRWMLSTLNAWSRAFDALGKHLDRMEESEKKSRRKSLRHK